MDQNGHGADMSAVPTVLKVSRKVSGGAAFVMWAQSGCLVAQEPWLVELVASREDTKDTLGSSGALLPA